jgi:MFS family permease
LLKNSPAENRTMYIAAGTALAGMVGGVTSVLAGIVLSSLNGWRVDLNGYDFTGFHLMFVISIALRLLSLLLVARIQEPHVYETMQVVTQLVGVTPLRLLRYPVGLYREWSSREVTVATEVVTVLAEAPEPVPLPMTPPVLKPEFVGVPTAVKQPLPAPHVRLAREEEPVGAR